MYANDTTVYYASKNKNTFRRKLQNGTNVFFLSLCQSNNIYKRLPLCGLEYGKISNSWIHLIFAWKVKLFNK